MIYAGYASVGMLTHATGINGRIEFELRCWPMLDEF